MKDGQPSLALQDGLLPNPAWGLSLLPSAIFLAAELGRDRRSKKHSTVSQLELLDVWMKMAFVTRASGWNVAPFWNG